MRRLLLFYTIAVIFLGRSTPVKANLTQPQSESNQFEPIGAVQINRNSENPDDSFEKCLHWLWEYLFGWDRDGKERVYNSGPGGPGGGPGDGGSGGGPGDGGSGGGPGDGGWGGGPGGPGDGGSGGGPGDGGWGGGSGGPGDGGSGGGPGDGGWGGPGDGGWSGGSGGGCGDNGCGGGCGWGGNSGGGSGGGGSDTCPVQPIPAPGAIVLSGIGLTFLGWLRRRHIL